MINYFLGVALVAAPFFIKLGTQTTTVMSQEYFLLIISFVGVMLFGTKANNRIKLITGMIFAFAFTAINPFGIYQLYQLGLCMAGAALIAMVHGNKDNINVAVTGKCLGIVCLVESAWIILQYFGISLHAEWIELVSPGAKVVSFSQMQIFGSLGNINHSGALVACTIPFVHPFLWPIAISSLLIGKSTMPVVCAFVSMASFYSYRFKNYLILILSMTAVFMAGVAALTIKFVNTPFMSTTGRILAWEKLFKDIGFQLYGKGLGFVPSVFSQSLIQGKKFYQMHNEWIELYAIGGVVGVVVGLYLIIPVFKDKGNPAINACLISLLVNSLGNFTFHIAPLFMIFGTCYALQLEAKE